MREYFLLQQIWPRLISPSDRTIVVDHLKSVFKDDDDVEVIFIYCNYKQSINQSLRNLIGSLVRQLVQKRRTVSENITTLYNSHSQRHTLLSETDITQALQSEISNYSSVFLVVDALDECSETHDTRLNLLDTLRSLPGNVRLMVTSRYLPTIEREFIGVRRIEISATGDDVGRYVRGRIPKERRLCRHVKANKDLEDTIVNAIVRNVKGM